MLGDRDAIKNLLKCDIMGKAVKKDKKPKESKSKSNPVTHSKKKKGVKGIIRLAGTDMFGEVPLRSAVMRVRGVGHTTGLAIARILSKKFSVPDSTDVGDLTEKQLSEIDEVLLHLDSYLPSYLLNRRKDADSGEDKHVITNDLIFANRQDIEKEKKMYSWKGYRHAYGQRVRGQRSRNTGRQGKAVGVTKKKLQPGKSSAKKSAPSKK